jgi:ParB family chromosome partitioning protein
MGLEKQEACRLYIEQEIDDGLEAGETPYRIAKRLVKPIQKLFEVVVNRKTLESRAYRRQQEFTSNEVNEESAINTDSKSKLEKLEKPSHGGARPGAGRPPKIIVKKPTNRTQGTGENEWYTPIEYIEAARKVMGSIDLDPATSEFGQSRIKADKYYTKSHDGLNKPWFGCIWLNPPYSQPLISQFTDKLIEEINSGADGQAIILTHNYTDTEWFHKLESVADLLCFTKGRIKYEAENGKVAQPTQGAVFFYIGNNMKKFKEVFSRYGFIR